MTISVDHDGTTQALLPDSIAVAPFEVLDVRELPTATTDDGVRSTWALTLTAFELGDLEIPPCP